MNYFITENYIKDKTPITKNVDVNLLTPYIATASDMWVKKTIGTFFYNYLLNKYTLQTLTPNEILLVEYIQPVVAWKAAEDCVLGLSFQLKNKGLQQQSSDYSTNVDLKVVETNMLYFRQKSIYYLNELKDFLITNKGLYPEFSNASNIDSSIKDSCKNDSNPGYGFFII